MHEFLPILIVGAIIGVFTVIFLTAYALDKILFLEDGRLTAVGTHAQLQETCPAYRKMVELQKLEEEGGAQNA